MCLRSPEAFVLSHGILAVDFSWLRVQSCTGRVWTNSIYYSLSPYCVPGVVLSAVYALTHLLPKPPGGEEPGTLHLRIRIFKDTQPLTPPGQKRFKWLHIYYYFTKTHSFLTSSSFIFHLLHLFPLLDSHWLWSRQAYLLFENSRIVSLPFF